MTRQELEMAILNMEGKTMPSGTANNNARLIAIECMRKERYRMEYDYCPFCGRLMEDKR